MSMKSVCLERVKKLEIKINAEVSPLRKKRFEKMLKDVKESIRNIENYGSPKKPDGIPVGVRIGVPKA